MLVTLSLSATSIVLDISSLVLLTKVIKIDAILESPSRGIEVIIL